MKDFFQQLGQLRGRKTSISRLLELIAGSTGISNKIRYYSFDQRQKRLVSAGIFGHSDPSQRAKIRAGGIIKFYDPGISTRSDSFWCYEKKMPVLFRLSESAELPLKSIELSSECLFVKVSQDECDYLKKPPGQAWIDLPLFVTDTFVGKLSCDLTIFPTRDSEFAELRALWRDSLIAAPYLNHLYVNQIRSVNRAPKAEQLKEKISSCETLDSLFEICVSDLPELFSCRNGSVFTLSTDSLGWQNLILRKTSFQPEKSNENKIFYDLGKDKTGSQCKETLTGWVAANGRTVRIQNLRPGNELDRELKAYDSELKWGDFLRDSKSHTSYLAVPIPDVSGSSADPLGVLRITEKEGKSTRFTEQDQALLEWFCQDCIAAKLASIPFNRFTADVFTKLESIVQASILQHTQSATDLGDTILTGLEKLFTDISGDTLGERLYFINILDDSRLKFTHHNILKIGLDCLSDKETEFPYRGSLTKLALETNGGDDQLEPVFINNIKNAEQEEVIHLTVPDAVCAIACGLRFGGRKRGAIVALSNHYGLSEKFHGRILQLFASQVAQIDAAQQVRKFSFAIAGMRHDFLKLMQLIEVELLQLKFGISGSRDMLEENLAAIKLLRDAAYRLASAYLEKYPVNPRLFEKNCLDAPVDIREIFLLAKVIGKSEFPLGVDVQIGGDLLENRLAVDGNFILAILYNLLKNSLSASQGHTNRPIEIEASMSINESALEVKITDRGRGMNGEQSIHVRSVLNLDPLEDVQRILETHSEFSGKGLLISAMLAEHYRISDGRTAKVFMVDSKVDNGSIFQVCFPIPINQPTKNTIK